ncbi:MAG TPA: hypothetical protein VMZ06_03040 [Candidatus Bathyarchaeia archaeon]|nr:hypothetical protein [Candidatus Bathyarchaeia archaeon]
MRKALVAVILAHLLCGCVVFRGIDNCFQKPALYQRPELFSPNLAVTKYLIEHPGSSFCPPNSEDKNNGEDSYSGEAAEKVPANIVILGPEAVTPALSGEYVFHIADKTGSADQRPIVSVTPQEAVLELAPLTSSNWLKLRINRASLASAENVTIAVMAAAAQNPPLTQEEAEEKGFYLRLDVPVNSTESDPTPLTLKTDIYPLAEKDAAEEFGAFFASVFTVCHVNFINQEEKPLLVYGSSLTAEVNVLLAEDDVRKQLGQPALDDPRVLYELELNHSAFGTTENPVDELDWYYRFRPLCFRDILAMFEFQRRSDERQRLIDYLMFAGAIAAPLDIFVTHRDYATGVALFTGVFTPELEKLILGDILLHAERLQSRSLREIEELPGYGQLDRLVFFPRRPIYGLVHHLPAYLGPVDITSAQVAASYVEKLGPDMQEALNKQTEQRQKDIEAALKGVADSPAVQQALATLAEAKAKQAEKEAQEAQERANQSIIPGLSKDDLTQLIPILQTIPTAQPAVPLLQQWLKDNVVE